MNPQRIGQWASSPWATLTQLVITAIAIPLVGFVGSRLIDELVSLNKAVARIETQNATTDQRTKALEILGVAHTEAIQSVRDKVLRHDMLLERLLQVESDRRPNGQQR